MLQYINGKIHHKSNSGKQSSYCIANILGIKPLIPLLFGKPSIFRPGRGNTGLHRAMEGRRRKETRKTGNMSTVPGKREIQAFFARWRSGRIPPGRKKTAPVTRAPCCGQKKSWQRPTFPPFGSIIGEGVLDFRVRNGNGYFHLSMATSIYKLCQRRGLRCPAV